MRVQGVEIRVQGVSNSVSECGQTRGERYGDLGLARYRCNKGILDSRQGASRPDAGP